MRIQFWHISFVCRGGFCIENMLLFKEKKNLENNSTIFCVWVFSVSTDVCGMPMLMCEDTVLGTISRK